MNGVKYCFLIALLISSASWALPEDRDQPIRLKADQAELDDQKGIAVYQGNVRIKQGSLEITADKVTVHSDDQGVKLMIAVGNPAYFEQQTDPDTLTKGHAQTLEYHADVDRAVFITDAFLNQGEDTFKGDRIEFDIETDVINATSTNNQSGDSQVEILLMPRSKTPAGN